MGAQADKSAQAQAVNVSASYTGSWLRMAGELDQSQNDYKEFPLREESEEAARRLEQQRHREAYGRRRPPTSQPRCNLRSGSSSTNTRLETSSGCTEEGGRTQHPPAIEQNAIVTPREQPLSSPHVDYDTESQELNDDLPSEGDRVRKRSPEARLTSGHIIASQVCDDPISFPLSSSDTAEEQGVDHDSDWKCPPRAKKGEHHQGKRGN